MNRANLRRPLAHIRATASTTYRATWRRPKRKRFAETAIGCVHIDVCGLRFAGGKPHMVLAIDA